MKKILFIIFIFIIGLAYCSKSFAKNQYDILINEIAWMGSTVSANDEWIELFNNTEENISLDGWVLKSDDGSPEVKLLGKINSKSFYLLERTNDNSVKNIKADKIYSGSISNSGENFILYDNQLTIIDRASFSSGWPFGSNTTKQTIERSDFNSWQTSSISNGTPKENNSLGLPKVVVKKIKSESLLKEEKSDNESSIATASLNNQDEAINDILKKEGDKSNYWMIFMIIGGVILIMGSVILFWKIKFKK
ncbi:MAG: lamin tail domain-containing protein [Candidatus Staskawiczbacteria bacterium]|nr:lamin tail domain-containing protein [Candidatus Staskawiczbacteria bacterium]